MADVITLKNGRNEIVFDEHMGSEARRWLEDWMTESGDAIDYIGDLEKEADSLRAHHKDVMVQLRQQSETIAGMIREKNIDRKALSTAAGQIGCITWRARSSAVSRTRKRLTFYRNPGRNSSTSRNGASTCRPSTSAT